MAELTQERLKELLHYNEKTGIFTNLTTRSHLAKKGDTAGSIASVGYIYISLLGKKYLAHRLAWLYCYGSIPESNIDHIDGNKVNNVLANLRLATKSQNAFNSIKKITSLYRGVTKNRDNFSSRITILGDIKELGTYSTPEEASIVYETAAKSIQGEFYLDPNYSYDKRIIPKRIDRAIGGSGYRGVWKMGKKFQAVISKSGIRSYLGTFATAEEASKAYEEAKNG